MKPETIVWHKAKVHEKYIIELRILDVGKSKKYPKGFKYSLICIDVKTQNKILFDNHYPKGGHIHINNEEIPYTFISNEQLINDFKNLILKHFGVKL